jgi:hypothetical protein
VKILSPTAIISPFSPYREVRRRSSARHVLPGLQWHAVKDSVTLLPHIYDRLNLDVKLQKITTEFGTADNTHHPEVF